MNSPSAIAQSSTITLGDIYYVLFRQKWKIICCTVLGLAAAGAYRVLYPPPFQSQAKLFIRYVITDSKTPTPGRNEDTTKSPDMRGETIMASELEILTSLDLAKQVAEAVGPEKILAKAGGGKDPILAAALLRKGLSVVVPPRSSVIVITLEHPDPEVVQPALREVIDRYLKMHVEIHRAVGIIGDFLNQETDTLRASLSQTEDELRKARIKIGVISIESAQKSATEEIGRIREEIFNAQAELAERSTVLEEMAKRLPPAAHPAEAGPEVPADQSEQYKNVSASLDLLQKKEQELLTQFTPENGRVKEIHAQGAEMEKRKRKLEADYPRLLLRPEVSPPKPSGGAVNPIDLNAEAARLAALQAKIKVLNSQLDEIRGEAAKVDQMEGTVQELRRRKELQEANYRYYAATLEQARIDEALGNGRVSNISRIQEPSPPAVDVSQMFKTLAGLSGGGLAIGLAWAFLIELYFDHTVRRPVDIERTLPNPLFISIPDVRRNGFLALQRKAGKNLLLPAAASATDPAAEIIPLPNGDAMAGSSDPSHPLHIFHETLRDRLIGFFESINLTHKPKLVAVTGLGKSAGVTTTAAGLASSLSETRDGNVLLVDMTPGQGSALQFQRGKPVCGLEELLSTRDNAQVEQNLFVVAEGPGADRLSRIMPTRFNQLVPRLKASDFDYIIFDMPPVSEISVTPRLAGFMDLVLLVVESEKTSRNIVQRATARLAETKARVGIVLNKTHAYVPARLHQENLGNV